MELPSENLIHLIHLALIELELSSGRMFRAYILSDRGQFTLLAIYKWGFRRDFRNLLFANLCSQRHLRPCECELMRSATG